MATLYPNIKYTLMDRAKDTADGKTVLPTLQVMNRLGVDDFFNDVPFIEANMGLKHRIKRTSALPTSTNRTFYKGVAPTKASKQVVYEDVMLKEQRREIDEDEVDTLANPKELLRQEDEFHQEALGQDVVTAFFQGSVVDGSEHVDGLLGRLDALNPTGLNNVQSAGFTTGGSTTSRIVIVEWNPGRGCYGIYPPGYMKNTKFGISARDKGKEPIADADDTTAKYYAYVAQFKAWLGLAVGDNRNIGALVNVNPTPGGTGAIDDDLLDTLSVLMHSIRADRARSRIYVNETIAAQLDNYSRKKSNVFWPTTEVFGRPVKNYQGIPIRELDNTILTNTQAVVS
uniref:Putative capsid protein n=1 Tax=viral metagenome TaxID=1070528 RepID=A0A6M3K0U1_9ZZZZ